MEALGREFLDDFKKYVTKVFLTASSDSLKSDGSDLSRFFETKAVNYTESREKLGTKISSQKAIPQVKSFCRFIQRLMLF